MRPRQSIATGRAAGESRVRGEGDTARRRRPARAIHASSLALSCLATVSVAAYAANPLTAIGETFSDWKDRLFGKPNRTIDAPADGTVSLAPKQPTRVRINEATPERDFPKGKSRFRVIDLPAGVEHAAVRVQITAMPRDGAFGHEVFKPYLYTLNADDTVRDTIEVKPLHLDIRPFRSTRLLGCATLENVERFAIATQPEVVGKSYESEVRDSIKAPTQGGYYYATDAVKVKLPFAATGEVVLEVTQEPAAGKGC
ncbi:MAG: hypothetical protein ABW186_02910 [Rhodanobacteraceae bacterium]